MGFAQCLSVCNIFFFRQGETTKEVDATGAILQQLVTLLTSAEQAQLYASTEPARPSPPTVGQGGGGREEDVQKEDRREGSGQVHYRAGDLGLLPRPQRKARTTTPDK